MQPEIKVHGMHAKETFGLLNHLTCLILKNRNCYKNKLINWKKDNKAEENVGTYNHN